MATKTSSSSKASSSPSRTTSAPAPAPKASTPSFGTPGLTYNSGGGVVNPYANVKPSTPTPSSGGGSSYQSPAQQQAASGWTPVGVGQTGVQNINGQTVTTTNNNGNYTSTFANTGPTTTIGGNTYNSGGGLVGTSSSYSAPTAYTPTVRAGAGSTNTLATQRGAISSMTGGRELERGEMGYSKQEKKKRDAARAVGLPASPVNEPGILEPTVEAPELDPREATLKALQIALVRAEAISVVLANKTLSWGSILCPISIRTQGVGAVKCFHI